MRSITLIEALVRVRAAAKLTQAKLTRRLGTTQSAVARVEGGWMSPSFAILRHYAQTTGTRLTDEFQRRQIYTVIRLGSNESTFRIIAGFPGDLLS